jgi:hypothetical protein
MQAHGKVEKDMTYIREDPKVNDEGQILIGS